jgi:hypothetical protein
VISFELRLTKSPTKSPITSAPGLGAADPSISTVPPPHQRVHQPFDHLGGEGCKLATRPSLTNSLRRRLRPSPLFSRSSNPRSRACACPTALRGWSLRSLQGKSTAVFLPSTLVIFSVSVSATETSKFCSGSVEGRRELQYGPGDGAFLACLSSVAPIALECCGIQWQVAMF